MPGDHLTPSESAILVVLMAEAREMSNTELKERYGVDIRKPARDKLNKLGYLESSQSGRTWLHQLADGGWAHVQDGLDLSAARPRIIGGALSALLVNLRDRVAPRDDYGSFGELFARSELRATAGSGEPRADRRTAQPEALRARVRDAYAALATEPGDWISLTRLRPLFPDVAAADLDDALRALEREPDVNIVPESNAKTLTDADDRAAIRIGGQDKHLLAIGV
ncbi:hypothetical protein ACFY3U_03970 [Micromonospora sp. NPDC000089]|uniref:hypothetical protein n=1 Tax=unclassified Micromonospora TaxID=2617518 RepID=UPI0036ADC0CE